MKCPSCGYVSFQNAEECVNCERPLPPGDGETASDSDFRRGMRRKKRNQMGFGFPDADADDDATETGEFTVADETASGQTVVAEPVSTMGFDVKTTASEWTTGSRTKDDDSSFQSGTHVFDDAPSDSDTWISAYRLASGFGRRAAAMLLDTSFFIALFAILLYALQPADDLALLRTSYVPAYVFLLVLHGFYYTFFHAVIGQTPGKMVFGIKVVGVHSGEPLAPWDAFLRWLGYFFSALPAGLGFLWSVIDNDDRGFHDKWAKSVVVVTSSAVEPDAA